MTDATTFRFRPTKDVYRVGNQLETWINVDEPHAGSMRILHEAMCTDAEARTRARMIAAAPEILENLRNIVGAIECGFRISENCGAMIEARAAIRKAVG